MSEADRRKWDARYRDGAYASRPHPSAFLQECEALLPRRGRALDLACGAGRNALFLAQRGLLVDAVDMSAAALAAGRKRAGDLPIKRLEQDLDDGFEPTRPYDVIVNIRFVQLDLVQSLVPALQVGDMLLVEQHLRTNAEVAGPRNPAFRVAPGAPLALAGSLVIERAEEGLFVEPDGARAALARLVARRGEESIPTRLGPSSAAFEMPSQANRVQTAQRNDVDAQH